MTHTGAGSDKFSFSVIKWRKRTRREFIVCRIPSACCCFIPVKQVVPSSIHPMIICALCIGEEGTLSAWRINCRPAMYSKTKVYYKRKSLSKQRGVWRSRNGKNRLKRTRGKTGVQRVRWPARQYRNCGTRARNLLTRKCRKIEERSFWKCRQDVKTNSREKEKKNFVLICCCLTWLSVRNETGLLTIQETMDVRSKFVLPLWNLWMNLFLFPWEQDNWAFKFLAF